MTGHTVLEGLVLQIRRGGTGRGRDIRGHDPSPRAIGSEQRDGQPARRAVPQPVAHPRGGCAHALQPSGAFPGKEPEHQPHRAPGRSQHPPEDPRPPTPLPADGGLCTVLKGTATEPTSLQC